MPFRDAPRTSGCGQPPFRPALLTMLILVALLAGDGMAALLLERLKQRLVRQGEASRHIYVPSPASEDEALAAVQEPLDQAERDAVGREMARSAGALADVEQEVVRWALNSAAAISSLNQACVSGSISDAK